MHALLSQPRFLSALAFVAGLVLPLALAPFDLWPLVWVSLAGYFWVIHRATSARQAAWFGFCYGAGLFGLGISWVYASMRTVATPVPLSVLMTAAFCLGIAALPSLQGWLYQRFLRTRPLALALGAPGLWLVFEWLRSWLLTGMPWLLAGYSQTNTPLGQLGAVIGVYGLGLVIALGAAALAAALEQGRAALPGLVAALALTLAAFAAGAWLPAERWTRAGESLAAVAIQSNVAQADKWRPDQLRPTLDFYSRQASEQTAPDLMVWPEAALTARPGRLATYLDQLDELGRDRDQGILTGIISDEDGRFFNALVGFGTAAGEYRKQHLVPFGEYLPFEDQLRGLIRLFSIPMSTMSPALRPQAPLPWDYRGETRRLAAVICYEAAYPGLVRELARDSDLLVMVSNDAWFGDSLAPHQHLQISRMRAIENGRDLVRSTQTGISALIDAGGRVLARSDQFVVAAVSGEVRLRTGLTPYQRWGGLAWMVVPLALIGLCFVKRSRRL